MSRDEKQTCANCKWWDIENQVDEECQCRADTPKFLSDGETGWPWTRPAHWCGKFTARDPSLSDQDRKFLGAIIAIGHEPFISLGDAASNVIQELASKRNSQP